MFTSVTQHTGETLTKLRRLPELVKQTQNISFSSNITFYSREIREVGFLLERRGGIEVKGKGIMDTYFINGVSDDFDLGRKSLAQTDIYREPEPERIAIKRVTTESEQKPRPGNSSFCSVM